jgi:hypothetical protein
MTTTPDGRELPLISAMLWLRDDAPFDPGEMTRRVGLEPTNTYRRGDRGPFEQPRKRDFWGVRVGPNQTLDVQALLRELMDRVQPRLAAIRETCAELGLTPVVSCTIELKSTLTPVIQLSRGLVQQVAELSDVLDVDVMASALEPQTAAP